MKLHAISISALLCLSTITHAQQGWQPDTVKINGIRQVIATKGKPNAPVLLFLHGGPGGSRMQQADVVSNELQKHFLVVQWDQRESGKTLALNKTDQFITLDLMTLDARSMIDTLRKRYKQDKIYLLGESWGSALGFQIVQFYPQKLQAYLAFAPVVDQIKSEKLLQEMLLNDAKAKGNTAAIKELSRVRIPFGNYEELYYLRKWWFNYDGHTIGDKDTTLVKNYLKTWADTWLPTWDAAMTHNLFNYLLKAECPVYFFVGGKDFQTNAGIAKAYYEKLEAPDKKLYWFENASHDVLVTDAPKVQQIIISEILKK